jgi:hypothetical protein
MAKRFKVRSARRGFIRKIKSKTKRAMGGLMMPMVGAGLYGVGRRYLSNFISPLTSKIPLGQYADEAGMLIANYALYKFAGRMPMIKDAAKAGMLIETAMLAEQIAGGVGTTTSESTSYGWE